MLSSRRQPNRPLKHAHRKPVAWLAPQSNHGNYVCSLSQLVRWLGRQAEEEGVEVYPGFAAAEVLYNDQVTLNGHFFFFLLLFFACAVFWCCTVCVLWREETALIDTREKRFTHPPWASVFVSDKAGFITIFEALWKEGPSEEKVTVGVPCVLVCSSMTAES